MASARVCWASSSVVLETVRSRCSICGWGSVRPRGFRQLRDLLKCQPDITCRITQHEPVLPIRIRLAWCRWLVAGPEIARSRGNSNDVGLSR
jgi:hypothetical protein